MNKADRNAEEHEQFLRAIAHELRTPLSAIIGFSDILLNEENHSLDDDQINYLRRIYRAGDFLGRIHDGVLELLRIQAGSFKLENHPVVLKELIEDLLLTLDQTDAAAAVEMQVPDEITLVTDSIWLRRCIDHYLSNALRHANGSPVKIVAVSEGATVKISVIDSGPGISSEDLAKLFGPFPRVTPHPDMAKRRLGLGLYTTKLIMTRVLGGEVGVASRTGHGCEFTLELPVNPVLLEQ